MGDPPSHHGNHGLQGEAARNSDGLGLPPLPKAPVAESSSFRQVGLRVGEARRGWGRVGGIVWSTIKSDAIIIRKPVTYGVS